MRRYFLYILITLFSVCNVQAEFSLVHKTGAYETLQENGMQQAHTDYQIMYARPGDTVYLYRPERATFVGWIRWYCYDTDRAVPATYTAEESPSGTAMSRFIPTWIKDTIKIKASNQYGIIAFDVAKDRVTTADSCYIEYKYIMHNGDSIYRIACDEGIWNDFTWYSNKAVTEPTLSKRIIYEIRPASEIANQLNQCKDTNRTNNTFLEEYNMIAPTGRQLYIGPKHMYQSKKIVLTQYTCFARSNYYYTNEQGNIKQMGATGDNNWKWFKNGAEDSNIKLSSTSAQFVGVSNTTEDTVVYELKYKLSSNVYINVAKFNITYVDKNVVGPVQHLSATTKKMDKIYEETFNFDKPNTTDFSFWLGHFDVDESTYGYYDKNLDGSPSYRKIRKGNITWSEYAVTNKKSIWVKGNSSDPQTYQHVEGTENVLENAAEGYMLYCDGSQQPGQVFNLKVNTDLCPGTTMYFSAWLCDASSTGSGKSAPNMDFEVIGIDADGNEHALTTFTTGEFGINAVEQVGNNTKMERAKWYQIMFPVKFTVETTFHTYRLRITNKSTSSDGNDFAIDDIRIYVQKPPVDPIQASTYDCPTGLYDSITAYLRVDYQAIDAHKNTFYYQWRDGDDEIMVMPYFNGNNGDTSTYGYVTLPKSEEDVIAAGDTCSSLLSFDAKYYNTEIPLVKYVKEYVDASTQRYVMYIAQPMVARTNFKYIGHVAVRPEDLGSETDCGTRAELLVAGGTRILINGEALGDSVVDICGSRSYILDIVLTYVARNEETEELEEYNVPCRADWLIGDSTYVNANHDVYRYTFKQIEQAVQDYRTSDPHDLSITIVNHLLRYDLLVLNSATTIMQPSLSLTYTAFPINGSANNGMSVCLTPRFLHITPSEEVVNIMKVGSSGEHLPQAVQDKPRFIRVSNAQKNRGSFKLPLYLEGDPEEQYIVDSIHVVSSTDTTYHHVDLYADKDTINLVDTITIFGTNLSTLKDGHDYTIHIAFVGESAEDNCSRGYTYFTLRIIPDMVTWYGGRWNEDDNWDTFIPMKETDVILLENTDYNVQLSDSSIAQYDINYEENQCRNIYFPHGTSMAKQEDIDINGIAFIDVKEYAWKWTLTSIPIQGVVTGDLFISTNESAEPFVVTPINQVVGAYAEDRAIWQLYHKEFDAMAEKWKIATNTLTRKIVLGDANMIGIDCETDDVDPIIRLPKQDSIYHYFERNQLVWLPSYEYIERDENYGKPAWNGDNDIQLKEIYTNVYLFGNPTFGYINISKLVDDNSDKLTGKYYLEAEGAYKIPKKDEMINFNRDIDTDEYDVLLPPYRGILLEGTSSSDHLIINVNCEYVNPEGRHAAKRRKQDNVTTDTYEEITTRDIDVIYDIMGRKCSVDIEYLPTGIYIVRSGNKTYKIFKK